jgi:hypothetical protein
MHMEAVKDAIKSFGYNREFTGGEVLTWIEINRGFHHSPDRRRVGQYIHKLKTPSAMGRVRLVKRKNTRVENQPIRSNVYVLEPPIKEEY